MTIPVTGAVKQNRRLCLQLFALAACMVGALFLWQGHTGFNLWDEGFLWLWRSAYDAGRSPHT